MINDISNGMVAIETLGDCCVVNTGLKWFDFMEGPKPMPYGYYFWDETQTQCFGPYAEYPEAAKGLQQYAKELAQ